MAPNTSLENSPEYPMANKKVKSPNSSPISTPAYGMASAPRDGTWIFVYGIATATTLPSEPVEPSWFRAYWSPGGVTAEGRKFRGTWDCDDGTWMRTAVAWIPLLPPPHFPLLEWKGVKPKSSRQGAYAWVEQPQV